MPLRAPSVFVSILRAYEHRDCTVDIGGHRDDMIIAELEQCMILRIGLSDAADQRRVDNNGLASLQFGEPMERDAHDISPPASIQSSKKGAFASAPFPFFGARQYATELATRLAKDQIDTGTARNADDATTVIFGSGNRTMTFDALPGAGLGARRRFCCREFLPWRFARF